MTPTDVRRQSPAEPVLVLGAGVIGLCTAWHLRERGHDVEVWTRDDPELTTSSVAAAIWYPFLAEPRQRVLAWSRATFDRLAELAAVESAGVRMQEVVEVFDDEQPDLWWAAAVPGLERLPPREVPGGHRAAIRARVPMCDVPIHLRWLLAGLEARGVRIVRREVAALEEAFDAASTVVNCTGLGARELCGDRDLHAVRGQVLRVTCGEVQQAWIDDTGERPCYVIPRSDGVLVGGTAQPGDERLDVDEADSVAILARARAAIPLLRDAPVAGARVGLRPYRSTVRLECESVREGQRLVHNYGHGGSGYTLAWGCAEEVAVLVSS